MTHNVSADNWHCPTRCSISRLMRDDSHADSSEAYEIYGESRSSGWLVTCDHASNDVPPWVGGGDLGIAADDMARHIAWDVGAAGLTRYLADALDAPAVLSRFSRLVIDPNRGEDDPTLVMQLYDGTVIPANRGIGPAAVSERLDRLYRPYHAAVAARLADRPRVLAIHSFTPRLRGRAPRPWHIGLLSASDRRLADPLLDILSAQPDLVVGDNEPYAGALAGDALDRHAVQTGLPHILIEMRSDLIATDADQRHWAARLAPVLAEAAAIAGV